MAENEQDKQGKDTQLVTTEEFVEDVKSNLADVVRGDRVISKADLRLDVAGLYNEAVETDETVNVDKFSFHTNSPTNYSALTRVRNITGTYSFKAVSNISNQIQSYTERVNGRVLENLPGGESAMIGGAYTEVMVGTHSRLCGAMFDGKGMGGWLDADLARVEIASIGLRAYWGYAEAVGARVINGMFFVDEFATRVENYGVLKDSRTNATVVSTPGSYQKMEN